MSAISYIWCEYRFVWPLGKGCVFQMCEYKWSCNEHTFDVSTDLSGSLVRAVSFECVSHCKYSMFMSINQSINQIKQLSYLILSEWHVYCVVSYIVCNGSYRLLSCRDLTQWHFWMFDSLQIISSNQSK